MPINPINPGGSIIPGPSQTQVPTSGSIVVQQPQTPVSTTVTLQPQQPGNAGMKQIAICVAPSVSGSIPVQTARTTSMASGQSLTTPSTQTTTTAFFSTPNQLSNLGLMVTRFPSDNRVPGTQLLVQSRPQQLTTVRPGVVVTTSNASVLAGQNSGTARIMHLPAHQTIRTIVQQPQAGGGSGNIQVMNLSVSNPTATSSASSVGNQVTIKQTNARGPINTFPFEAVNMIVSNDQRIVNVKQGGLQTQGGAVKISRPGTNVVGGNLGQPTKVISLTTNPVAVGPHSGAVNTQQVTRLGIIQQPNAGGKAGQIINIAMPKNQAVIINPSNHQTGLSGSPQVVGSFTTTSQLHHKNIQQQQTHQTMIPVLPSGHNVITMGQMHGRHTIIPAGTAISTAQFTGQQQRIITANTAMLSHQQTAQFHTSTGQVVSLAPGSPMKQVNITSSPLKATQQQVGGTPSSPRPSILTRKRVGESPVGSSVARNLSKSYQEIKSAADKPGSSSTTAIIHHPHDQEQQQHSIPQIVDHSSQNSNCQEAPGPSGTTTPRKKPRKQLLEPFSHISALSGGMKLMTEPNQFMGDLVNQQKGHDYSEDILTDDANSQEEEEDYEIEDDEEDQGAMSPQTLAATRKPRLSLLSSYGSPWKSLQYHFLRYTDVKPKAEKNKTLSELSNEGLQKKNGWKIHHLATQMEDMAETEGEIYERLNGILSRFEEKVSPLPGLDDAINPDLPVKVSISDKLTDLIRGNLQRSNVFQDQINESRSLLIKLTNDHREKVGKVTRKNINKRTCISK
jgi:hypothetical protein